MQTQNNTLSEAVQALDELTTAHQSYQHWDITRSGDKHRVMVFLPPAYEAAPGVRRGASNTHSLVESEHSDLLAALNAVVAVLADLPVDGLTVLDVLAAETAPL